MAFKKAVGWGGGSPTSLLVLVVVRFPTAAMRPFSAAQSQLFQHQGLRLITHLRLRPQSCISAARLCSKETNGDASRSI